MFPDGLFDSPHLRTLAFGIALLAGIFAVVVLLELLARGDLRRYRTRNFATDLTYAVVYVGGIYGALIYAPVVALITVVIPETWNLRLLEKIDPVSGFLIFWVLSDAIGYWLHRWQHASPTLWRLHSVHHAQTCLTFATSWRNHFVEQLYVNVLMYVPLMLLGFPKWSWMPAMLLQYLFEAVQHSDLRWRYGPFYGIFVSPVFHAIHHAPERSRHDRNYGKILSVWDWLFGTLARGERPERYGVAGLAMPVGFWATVAAPFRAPSEAPAPPDVAPTAVSGRN